MSNKILVTIGLILILILFLLSHNLYFSSNYDFKNNKQLNFNDTIKNIFGILPTFDISLDINNINSPKNKSSKKYKKKL